MFAAAGIAAANGGGVASSARSMNGSLSKAQHEAVLSAVVTRGSTSRYEQMRSVYGLMNRRAEELRQEENSATPDPTVLKDLKSELRTLAAQL